MPFRDKNPKKIRTTLPTVGQFSAAAEPRPQDHQKNQFSEKKGVQGKGVQGDPIFFECAFWSRLSEKNIFEQQMNGHCNLGTLRLRLGGIGYIERHVW